MVGLFGKKSFPVLGIDISSTSIKLIELSKGSAGTYKVESYATELLPANSVVDKRVEEVEAVGESIEKALKKSGSKLRTAAIAVSGSSVITRVIPMAADLSDNAMADQLLIEADQYIPYDMEEVSYDFSVTGPTEGNPDQVDVLLAAAQQDSVDGRVECCEYAGLEPKIVDIEAYAVEHAFELIRHQLPHQGGGKVVAVVDIGATTMTLSVFNDGKVIYTRDQMFGGKLLTEDIMSRYGLSYEDAERGKCQGGLPEDYEVEVLNSFKQNIVHEINRALPFFFANSSFNAVDNIVVAGGSSAIPGVDTIVAEGTGVQTVAAKPLANQKTSRKVNAERIHNDSSGLLICLGLALRSFD